MSTMGLIADTFRVTAEGRWLVLAWLFVLGAVFGSFLNVVIYRLPRRMSLSHPASRCPSCGHPIRWRDNVPIASWLILGGRCRDCRAPISPRYPLVELLVASTSAVGWADALQPIANAAPDSGMEYALALAPYAFHMVLVCTLLCAALVELDGHWPPLRMLLGICAIGLTWGAIWPAARGAFAIDRSNGLAAGIYGLGAGLALAAVAWPAWIGSKHDRQLDRSIAWACELALVGVYLGVRAVSFVALSSLAFCFVLSLLSTRTRAFLSRRAQWSEEVALTALLAIIIRPEVLLPGPFPDVDSLVLCVAGALVAVLAAVLRILAQRSSMPI